MAEETISPFSPPKANLEGGAAAAGTQELAPRGTRLLAALLDGLLLLAVMVVLWIGTFMNASVTRTGAAPNAMAGILAALGGLLMLALCVLQIYLLSATGQTLGKRWTKIRIVRLDGSNPGFIGAFLVRWFVNGLLGMLPFYSLVDILFIFNDDQRCLHDKIAGTRVVVA